MAHPLPPAPEVLSRTTLVDGIKFDFEEILLRSPAGTEFRRQHVRHPGAACILPVLEKGGERSIVFVRNYRAAVGTYMLELPAGTLEPGEAPEACAGRELIEETGYAAATLVPLGRFHTSPGLSDETMWAFVASDLRQVGQALEADEQLVVDEVPLTEARGLVLDGKMTDAKSMLTILLAAARGLLGAGLP